MYTHWSHTVHVHTLFQHMYTHSYTYCTHMYTHCTHTCTHTRTHTCTHTHVHILHTHVHTHRTHTAHTCTHTVHTLNTHCTVSSHVLYGVFSVYIYRCAPLLAPNLGWSTTSNLPKWLLNVSHTHTYTYTHTLYTHCTVCTSFHSSPGVVHYLQPAQMAPNLKRVGLRKERQRPRHYILLIFHALCQNTARLGKIRRTACVQTPSSLLALGKSGI
jgi:hypothetical protein